MYLFSLYKKLRDDLRSSGKEPADIEAFMVLQYVIGIDRQDLIINKDKKVSRIQQQSIKEIMQERIAGRPLSKIFGFKSFWGHDFKVTDDTLDPRADSETLIEAALKHYPDRKKPLSILDIGTGSGCLILSLLSEFPAAMGTAIDISPAALNVAKENAGRLNLDQRCAFVHQSWQELNDKTYDLVVSNPPYIDKEDQKNMEREVLLHDPHDALFAVDKGLGAYKELSNLLYDKINKDNGHLILEIGYQQAEAVTALFEDALFKRKALYKDYGGRDRCLVFVK